MKRPYIQSSLVSFFLFQNLCTDSDTTRGLLSDLFVGQLSVLARKFLTLEQSAAAAEDTAFIDLTSGDGEWFLLDDIHMQIGLVVQVLDTMDFLGVLPSNLVAAQCLFKLNGVTKQLHHFNSSFFGIILQEGLKSFQREDPTGEWGGGVFFEERCPGTSVEQAGSVEMNVTDEFGKQ